MSENERRFAELSPEKRELLRQMAARQRSQGNRIQPRARPSRLPLMFGQRRLWLLDQLTPGLSSYNVPYAMWLDGEINRDALRAAAQSLLDRHEVLRTIYSAVDGVPEQVIPPSCDLPWAEIDTTGEGVSERRRSALQLARSEGARPFDLARDAMLRVALIKVSDQSHLLLLTFHHIAVDGWSISQLLSELEIGYRAHCAGVADDIAPPRLQLADIALWQQETIEGGVLNAQLQYWCEHLHGAPTTLDLPSDRPRPAVQSFRGAFLTMPIPSPLLDKLEQLARSQQATLSMVFLAAFQTLLSRYTGAKDLVLGMGVAGRSRIDLESVVGFFVNTLPVRASLAGDPNFLEALARVRESVLAAMENADAPLDRILEELRLPRSNSHTPYSQVLYFFQNFPEHLPQWSGLETTLIDMTEIGTDSAQAELSLYVNQRPDPGLTFQYNTDMFDEATIARCGGHLLNLLEGAAEDPATPLSRLPLLTSAERAELADWNNTTRELPEQPQVVELVHAQVARSPDAVAVVFGKREMSYRELDQRANALAHRLREAGVAEGSLVGLYVERSFEMVIGLIGILKAGAAYVPLDPTYPTERLHHMLASASNDSRGAGGGLVLVSTRDLERSIPPASGSIVWVDANAALDASAKQPPTISVAGDDPAYVIFTSGSTGKPKGVEIRQQGAVNLLRSVARKPGMDSSDTIAAISTLSFDIALFELVLPLTVGAKILLVDRETARDGLQLRRFVEAVRPTIMQATPATWRMLLEVGWPGDSQLRLISTGEALPRELANRLLACGRQLWNLYGPTETTVYSALWLVESGDDAILVGQPVDNTQIHIVDRDMNLLPIGVAGELLIGGEGLATGYRGRPDLTADRFIPDPFGKPGGRLYRSGDLACWRPDGTIEVLGRIDHQVKIRGFRIELGEVEAALSRHPAVSQAVVHCREDKPGDKRLVAYLTFDGAAASSNVLREHLKTSLPDYMVPAAFVVLATMPLTPNGKVDRRALPPPESVHAAAAEDFVGPRTSDEEALARIWQQLLQIPAVDVRDDFFALGGHSLLATQMLARIEREFGIELPLRALFAASTLEQLTEVVVAEAALQQPDNIEELLRSLEQLTDEEANQQLAAARNVGEN